MSKVFEAVLLRPRKTWTSQIPDDTGMSSALTGIPPLVVAMKEGRYGL